MSEENPQPDPSGVKPQTSTPFGSLNDLQSVNLGQNEYFSTRDVISNSQRGYPFRGGDSPLVYPVDLAANTKSNRQSAALRFVPYKRESSQVRVELLRTNGSISGLGVGDVGESGEIEQGAFFNVNDDGVDVFRPVTPSFASSVTVLKYKYFLICFFLKLIICFRF